MDDVDARSALRNAAAGYPGAVEEFPWGQRVVKVHAKIFVFLDSDDADEPAASMKLPDSADHALSLDCAAPTRYGLGRAGWVTIRLAEPDCPAHELLLDWLDESYRAVAPARYRTQLDERSST